MKKISKLVLITLTSGFLLVPQSSYAFLDSIGNALSGATGGSSGGSAEQLATQSNIITRDFMTSFKLFSEALDLEYDASILEKTTNCATGKICTDSDDADRMVSMSEALSKKIKENQEKNKKLDQASKDKFAKGLLHYGTGIFKSSLVLSAVSNLVSESSSNPFAAIASAGVIAELTTQVPPTFSAFKNASGAVYDYANFNGIEKPEVAAAE